MYICDKCGDLMDELPTEKFFHTELDDCPCETFELLDCHCCGTYVHAAQCDICDEWFAEDQLHNHWCKACIQDYTTPTTILRYVNHSIELQKSFYVDAQFNYWNCESNDALEELLQICKHRFELLQSLGKHHPDIQSRIKDMLTLRCRQAPSSYEKFIIK